MSRNAVINVSERLVTEQCIRCGITFALPEELRGELVENHKDFYCPNGHSQRYIDKTEAQKQRERAERLAQQLQRREADLQRERTQHRATKGQLTKTKKRVANGVCPCCNRSFANVQRHMEGQHPEYVAEANQS